MLDGLDNGGVGEVGVREKGKIHGLPTPLTCCTVVDG